MGEVLFISGMVCGLILPFIFLTGKGRMYWLILMSIIGILLVATELISVVDTGRTISQHFWDWSLLHPKSALMVLGMLFCGWMVLLIHLGWKLLKKMGVVKHD